MQDKGYFMLFAICIVGITAVLCMTLFQSYHASLSLSQGVHQYHNSLYGCEETMSNAIETLENIKPENLVDLRLYNVNQSYASCQDLACIAPMFNDNQLLHNSQAWWETQNPLIQRVRLAKGKIGYFVIEKLSEHCVLKHEVNDASTCNYFYRLTSYYDKKIIQVVMSREIAIEGAEIAKRLGTKNWVRHSWIEN